MRRVALCVAVGTTMVAVACTGDDPPFNSSGAPGDGGASSSSSSSSSGGGSSSGADAPLDPGGPFVPSFGNNGTLALENPKTSTTMAVGPGGQVVWVYSTEPATGASIGIHRIDINGNPDNSVKSADLVLPHQGGDALEIATAAGFGRRGNEDYVFFVGGRGDKSVPGTPGSPTVWMRAYSPGNDTSVSVYTPQEVTNFFDVVDVAYEPPVPPSPEGKVYGAWTDGATDPTAYLGANDGMFAIAAHARAGGIALHPTRFDLAYGVARLVAADKTTKVVIRRINMVSLGIDDTWNGGGSGLELDVGEPVTSVKVVAIDGGKIAVGGTIGDRIALSTITEGAVPTPLSQLGTRDGKPIVNAMLRRTKPNDKAETILFAGCMGAPGSTHAWIAQVALKADGSMDYDQSFGQQGQYVFNGASGECVKAMGLDQNLQITVLIGSPNGDRIHKLTL